MQHDVFLGVDQGTSSTKAVLLDGGGTTLFSCNAPVPDCKRSSQIVEQDPEGLLSSIVEVFLKSRAWAREQGFHVKAAGMAFQRSGVLAWQAKDGVAVHPMLTWADTRTFPIIQNFGPGVERISATTGLPTIANFAAGKIALLQKQFRDPSVHVGTLDSFVMYRLSGRKVFITEDSMAARTMLYSIHDRMWSQELCREFKVEYKRLPRINPSIAPHTTFEGIPIVAMLGDQQAALLGRQDNNRYPLLNLGTIASVMANTGSDPVLKTGLMTSVLASRLLAGEMTREYRFLTEITSPVTGAVMQEPLKRGWIESITQLSTACETSFKAHPEGKATAYFVNHRTHLPQWPNGLPNVLATKPDATDADRVRAVVENVGNIVLRLFEELDSKGLFGEEKKPVTLDVAGGGGEFPYLLQYLSDCSGITLQRLPDREAGARGAALAALVSQQGNFEIEKYNSRESVETYKPINTERRKKYLVWQRLERDVLDDKLPPHVLVERI